MKQFWQHALIKNSLILFSLLNKIYTQQIYAIFIVNLDFRIRSIKSKF